ncbi:MAG TPA: hypothetical protein VFF77_00925 [Holophagaceae bacterium]|nr:hypothetical protein [Holophagaceae bacterium]
MSEKRADPFDHTVIMPGVPEMPAEATLAIASAPPAGTPHPAPRPRQKKWVALSLWAVVLLLLTGGMTWWLLGQGDATPRMAKAPAESLPAALQGYLDAAEHGDPKAMRMLGASYTYGLGVRPDKAEGAAWYRKAAEAGDRTAEAELKAAGAR